MSRHRSRIKSWKNRLRNGVAKITKDPGIVRFGTGVPAPDSYDSRDKLKNPPDGPLKPIDLIDLYYTNGRFRENWVIDNQYHTNRCTGFAGRSGIRLLKRRLETVSLGEGLKPARIDFSANELYWHARQDKGQDKGAFMRDLMKALKNPGSCDEWFWPDSHDLFKRPLNLDNAPRFCIDAYERIRTGTSISAEACQRVLSLEHLPVFVGAFLYEHATRDANRTGRFEMPHDMDKKIGGHAMLAVGWHRDQKNRVWFKLVNSWGDRVGDRGFFYMPEEYLFHNIAFDVWTVSPGSY